jgi:hypothetical protein
MPLTQMVTYGHLADMVRISMNIITMEYAFVSLTRPCELNRRVSTLVFRDCALYNNYNSEVTTMPDIHTHLVRTMLQ